MSETTQKQIVLPNTVTFLDVPDTWPGCFAFYGLPEDYNNCDTCSVTELCKKHSVGIK